MKVKAIVIKIRVKINIWQPTYTVGCKAILQKKIIMLAFCKKR